MIGIGVFEFIILLVLISTAGKVLTSWRDRPQGLPKGMRQEDVDRLQEAVSDLNTRLGKLEEERDFYRALLESPKRDQLPEPPTEA